MQVNGMFCGELFVYFLGNMIVRDNICFYKIVFDIILIL